MTKRKPPPLPKVPRRSPESDEDASPDDATPSASPPPPPAWAGAGVPEPVHDGPTVPYGSPHDSPEERQRPQTPVRPTSEPIVVHDERAFMQECADRLNAFLATYPDEAQHVLSTFVEYQHELVSIYRHLHRNRPHKAHSTPGVTVASLICALLQTHQGNGYVVRPLILPDPDRGVGCSRIERFVVDEQDDLDEGPPS